MDTLVGRVVKVASFFQRNLLQDFNWCIEASAAPRVLSPKLRRTPASKHTSSLRIVRHWPPAFASLFKPNNFRDVIMLQLAPVRLVLSCLVLSHTISHDVLDLRCVQCPIHRVNGTLWFVVVRLFVKHFQFSYQLVQARSSNCVRLIQRWCCHRCSRPGTKANEKRRRCREMRSVCAWPHAGLQSAMSSTVCSKRCRQPEIEHPFWLPCRQLVGDVQRGHPSTM